MKIINEKLICYILKEKLADFFLSSFSKFRKFLKGYFLSEITVLFKNKKQFVTYKKI